MTGLKGDIVQNNRINLEKLYECLKNQIYGYQLNFSDFQNIFGTQKFIKISEMSAILKSLDLQSFNLKQEVMQMCFENKKWKYSKVDKSMKEMGYQELNQKNKEIVIDCFDFNGDSAIDENDLDYLVEMIREYRSKSSENWNWVMKSPNSYYYNWLIEWVKK